VTAIIKIPAYAGRHPRFQLDALLASAGGAVAWTALEEESVGRLVVSPSLRRFW